MKNRKIISAFLMLLLAAITLTSASYAWFTANQTVSVAGLDVNVSASNGIQISTDAITWKASLALTDITTNAYTGNRNQVPGLLVPVSSPKTATAGLLDIYHGSVEDDGGTFYLVSTKRNDPTASASGAAASTVGDYVAFDVFIQSATAQTLKLTTDSNVVANGTDNGLKQASRVAIINQGTAADAASARALWGGTTTSTFLWEPNANIHTAAGIANANSTYAPRTGGTVTASTVLATYDAVRANSVLVDHVALGATATTDATHFSAITAGATGINLQTNEIVGAATTWTAASGSGDITAITSGITKLRVYAWIEGQDVDCENTASGTNITYNIRFTIA